MRRGLKVDCVYKGRRLTEISSFIDNLISSLQRRLAAASSLHFGGDEQLLADFSDAFVYVGTFAKEKFSYMDRIPYLLCNAPIPAVARECLSLSPQFVTMF